MQLIDFSEQLAQPITQFDSQFARSVCLGHGQGELHLYAVYFGPQGLIGPHPTGFCQFFLVVSGAGWTAGADGKRVALQAGQGVRFDKGETHAKGSESGMLALMVQFSERLEDS